MGRIAGAAPRPFLGVAKFAHEVAVTFLHSLHPTESVCVDEQRSWKPLPAVVAQ